MILLGTKQKRTVDVLTVHDVFCFLAVVPRNTSVGPRSKRAVTANPYLMSRPNLAAKGLKPGVGPGLLNGRSGSTNVVNRY